LSSRNGRAKARARGRAATVGLIAAVAGLGAGACAAVAGAQSSDPAYTGSSVMTGAALGINTGSGDRQLFDAGIPSLLAGAKIGLVRYPGGSGSDTFNWQTASSTTNFGQYMGVLAATPATPAPFITADYGNASVGAAVAGAWVTKALSFPNYSDATALWEVGNENYGAWENDTHPDPHTPQSYAANALPYFQAMHAADPSAQVGFPYALTIDQCAGCGTWIADPALWNKAILSQDGSQVDFADVHWYPNFGTVTLSNAQMFDSVNRIPAVMQSVRDTLDQYNPSDKIVVGESSVAQSNIVYTAQPVMALFTAATALSFISHGAVSYDWWQLHDSGPTGAFLGAGGLLSTGNKTTVAGDTSLTAATAPGVRNLPVASTANFNYGHAITIDTGAGNESRKITAVAGSTALAAPASAGDSRVYVNSATPFAAGSPIAIDSGAGAESRTVVAAGSGAGATTAAAPTQAGSTTLYVEGTPNTLPAGFVDGAKVTVDSGANAETATIASVGNSATAAPSSLGTTTVAPSAAGASTVYVASVTNTSTGVANYVGHQLVIDAGANQEVRTITGVGTGAGTATTIVTPAAAGDTVVHPASVAGATVGHPYLVDSGANLERATVAAVGTAAGAATTLVAPAKAGDGTVHTASISGMTAGHQIVLDTGANYELATIAGVGTAAPAATSLAAAAAAGDTTIKVASVANLTAGHQIVVDTGANLETGSIATVGTAGAAGTGVTLAAPLTLAHASGAAARDEGTGIALAAPLALAHAAASAARDAGTGITLATPLTLAHAAAAAARDAGTGMTLSAPLTLAHASGVATQDAGAGIKLTAPLTLAHASGVAITTPGTGLMLDAPLSAAHPSGATAASSGVTITPALSLAHAAGANVHDPGLQDDLTPVDAPQPVYFGYQMAALLTRAGARLTDLGTPAKDIRAYASYAPGSPGTENVMLMNTSDTDWKTVSLSGIAGLPDATWQTTSYGLEHPQITPGTVTAGAVATGLTLEPESMVVLSAPAASEPAPVVGPRAGVGGTVPATLSLALGAPASFGAFTPGVGRDYSASMTADVLSTAGDATLSVADPSATATGHLVNGAFSLPSALQADATDTAQPVGAFAPVGSSASPTALLAYAAPISHDPVTIGFKQTVGSTDALRTGAYSKTLTFTLSTTTP
jgi:hypothetical protein